MPRHPRPATRHLSYAVAALALALPAAASATPITPGPASSDAAFIGAAASAHPTTPVAAPQNPNMAANPNGNLHNDTWMTDAYNRPGPLGRNLETFSGADSPSLCGSLTFDTNGNVLAVCPSAGAPPQARIIDPKTLDVIARLDLPTAPDPAGTKIFQNFTGGGYFFLDKKNQIWSATKTSHLWVIGESRDGDKLVKRREFDLTSVLEPDERVTSALPDFDGNVWFVSKKNGKVGILDPKTGKLGVLRTGEEIENSFAVGEDGIYIVSDKRMYKFVRGKNGKPKIAWKVTYENSGIHKPSQVDAGSGTTPTLMPGGYVTITDNADPMNVVVYRTGTKLKKGQKRTVCEVPVFGKGASATENSLNATGRMIFVENNYGYQDPFGPTANAPTKAGFARVDINKKGTGCRKVWTNTTEAAPSVVPKLSTKTGLLYTYTQNRDSAGVQRWDWSAIDYRNGKRVWRQLAGTGAAFNNNYAGIAVAPDGSLLLGTIGGLVGLRDGS
jgi:hypothetical protein